MIKINNSEIEKKVQEKSTDKKEKSRLVIELFEESGNVTSIIRRSIKGNYHEKEIDIGQLKKEISDVIVCVVQLLNKLSEASLGEILARNLKKTHTNYSTTNYKQENTISGFSQYQDGVFSTYRKGLSTEKKERARLFAMGLMKEIGKISELYGEYAIDGADLDIYGIEEKLGDALWYLTAICQTYGINLEEVILVELENMRAKDVMTKAKKEEKKIFHGNNKAIYFEEYTEGTLNTPQGHITLMNKDDKNRELILGLFEEGGEVTELCSDVEANKEHLKDEIGDVLWYITQIANQLSRMNLENVALANLDKTYETYQKDARNIKVGHLQFNEYAEYAENTYKEDLPESQEERLRLFSIGLIKEIGKIAELYGENRIGSKKLDVRKVKEKLGDALWYLTAIARTAGLDLGEIADLNMQKTQYRKTETEGR